MVPVDSTFESEATLQEVFVLLTTCHPGFELGLGLQVTNKPENGHVVSEKNPPNRTFLEKPFGVKAAGMTCWHLSAA